MKSWFAPVKNYFSSTTDEKIHTNSTSNSGRSLDQSNCSKFINSQAEQNRSGQRQPTDFRLFSDSQMKNWSDTMRQNEESCNQNLGEPHKMTTSSLCILVLQPKPLPLRSIFHLWWSLFDLQLQIAVRLIINTFFHISYDHKLYIASDWLWLKYRT